MIWHTQDFTEKCEEECMVSIFRSAHVPWLNTETCLPLKFFLDSSAKPSHLFSINVVKSGIRNLMRKLT